MTKKKRPHKHPGHKTFGMESRHAHSRKVTGPPMVIDGEPVRRAAHDAHEKVRTQMEVMERQIKDFEQQELPAFQRWLLLSFGPMLTELKEIEQAAIAKEMILDRVQDYQYWENLSPVKAYARVVLEQENPDRAPEANAPDEPATDADVLSQEEEEELREAYEAASWAFENETGSSGPDFESFKHAIGLKSRQSKAGEDKEDSRKARIKKLYRRIARSLHPDCSDQFSLREQRLWHRAQEAYKAGDMVALETVLSHIEAAAAGPLFTLSVSELMENTREMRTRIDYLEEDLRQARQHPGWRFAQKTPSQLRSLHMRTEKELKQSLHQARRDLTAAETELRELELAYARMMARKKAGKAKRIPAVVQEDLPF